MYDKKLKNSIFFKNFTSIFAAPSWLPPRGGLPLLSLPRYATERKIFRVDHALYPRAFYPPQYLDAPLPFPLPSPSLAPFRLAASVLWCWSWEKEGRSVEGVPGIYAVHRKFRFPCAQLPGPLDQFIQHVWAECVLYLAQVCILCVCIALICLCVPILLCFSEQLSHLQWHSIQRDGKLLIFYWLPV